MAIFDFLKSGHGQKKWAEKRVRTDIKAFVANFVAICPPFAHFCKNIWPVKKCN